MNQYVETTENSLVHTYNRFPVVLDRGEGVYLYDTDGKKYLDFGAGIAVSGLGYGNPEFNGALKDQIDQLIHSSNLYYNTTCGKAAEALKEVSGMDRVFFTNSGTEAIEGALKAARKYAWKKGTGRYQFIAMENSFHGRSMGALSVTEHEAYRTPFEPLIPGVSFARFNDLDSVRELVTEKTCAIILEPLQGEGGINTASEEFMKGIRELCDKEGILMICDEIQCGMGRTGSMFAWQSYGTKPDIMAMAKAIGSGVPVGAFAMTEEVAKYSLEPGDHGTTYGGNPLACAAVAKTIEIFRREKITDHVQEVGAYLTLRLKELVESCDGALEQRGKGLIQGLKVRRPAGEICAAALKEGLLVISARSDVIRLVPPLVVKKEHIDELMEKLKKVL
ncbi:MAG TPA: aspartate aminotransferase family protein [Candidatus Dorea merdavium]|nr:aspartate aminotransferase family protein [Candidatus Dorea merdavium]